MITISNRDHWLLEQAEIVGENNFLITDDRSYPYSEIAEISKKAATYLKQIGVRNNDRIPILAENSVEFIVAINALWMLNAIPVPVNVNLTKIELTEVIEHLDTNFVIGFSTSPRIDFKECTLINFNLRIIYDLDPLNIIAKFIPDSNCLMLYTSGSTGAPKCVQLTFNNLFASIKSMDAFANHCIQDVWLASLPFNHIGGLSIIFRTLAAGCSLAFAKSLSHEELSEAIKKHQPSFLSVVPIMHKRILHSFQYPWSKLKNMFIGGGPITKDLVLVSLENKWQVSVVYGSTETSSMVTMATVENLSANGFSAGKPLPGVKIIINQNDLDKFSKNKIGQIIIESESVARSYYNYSKKTAELIDGKYYSNDLGKFDENGNLHIFGRMDDIIISGGENISLNEIENLLSLQSKFQNCVCLGIKDKKWGQSYIIVTDSTTNLIEDKILDYLRGSLAKHKFPKQIIRVNKIPLSTLGKPLKSELKKNINADFL